MKTAIVTAAIFLASVFGISQSGFAATSNNQEVSTILAGISNINSIEVHGNVELYVSDGTEEQVKVYNKYYAESALVQDDKGVLRISSYTAKKLVVWVKANNIQNISLYDNAEVKSFGKLSAIDLNVKLYDHSFAMLNLDTYQASIILNDHAGADLTGSTDTAELRYATSNSLNTYSFSANQVDKNPAAENDRHELSELSLL